MTPDGPYGVIEALAHGERRVRLLLVEHAGALNGRGIDLLLQALWAYRTEGELVVRGKTAQAVDLWLRGRS